MKSYVLAFAHIPIQYVLEKNDLVVKGSRHSEVIKFLLTYPPKVLLNLVTIVPLLFFFFFFFLLLLFFFFFFDILKVVKI